VPGCSTRPFAVATRPDRRHATGQRLPIGFAFAGCLLFALAGCQGRPAASASSAAARVPGEYLVQMASGTSGEAPLRQAFGDLGLRSVRALHTSRPVYRIRVDHDPGPQAMKRRAARVEAIVHVQPNYRYRQSDTPSGNQGEA